MAGIIFPSPQASSAALAVDPLADSFGPPDPQPDPQMDQRGEVAKSRMDRVLGRLPNVLSSKPVIIFGILLFCYLFLYAGIASLLGHAGAVSANTQLILGNYTNVSSSVGAGIAAGAGLTLLKRQRRTHRLTVAAHDAALEAKALALETHRILRSAFPEHAAALGQRPAACQPGGAASSSGPGAGGTGPGGPAGGSGGRSGGQLGRGRRGGQRRSGLARGGEGG